MNNLKLSLNIELEQSKIKAVINLTNKGKVVICINKRFVVNAIFAPAIAKDLAFQVISPNGKELDFMRKVNAPPIGYNHIEDLAPNTSTQAVVFLERYYQFHDKGNYIIQTFYENISDLDDISLWKGKLTSNKVIWPNS